MINILFGIAAAIAVNLTSVAQTIEQKPVECDRSKKLLDALQSNEYNEKPVWFGQDGGKKSGYVLLVNQKTQDWTLVQYNQEVACIIGHGSQSQILDLKEYM
jgi:sulfur carrier protein ThiS